MWNYKIVFIYYLIYCFNLVKLLKWVWILFCFVVVWWLCNCFNELSNICKGGLLVVILFICCCCICCEGCVMYLLINWLWWLIVVLLCSLYIWINSFKLVCSYLLLCLVFVVKKLFIIFVICIFLCRICWFLGIIYKNLFISICE